MYFVSFLKQGLEMEAVVLHRVGFLEYFYPKQCQDFKPSAAPIFPNMGKVSPPFLGQRHYLAVFVYITRFWSKSHARSSIA